MARSRRYVRTVFAALLLLGPVGCSSDDGADEPAEIVEGEDELEEELSEVEDPDDQPVEPTEDPESEEPPDPAVGPDPNVDLENL